MRNIAEFRFLGTNVATERDSRGHDVAVVKEWLKDRLDGRIQERSNWVVPPRFQVWAAKGG